MPGWGIRACRPAVFGGVTGVESVPGLGARHRELCQTTSPWQGGVERRRTVAHNQMMPAPAPRSRRPAGQTRDLMLEAAVERVKVDGLHLDYANIELEDLIRAAGVPRSTVFRIWPDRAAFVADLVRALFEADGGFDMGFDVHTLEVLQHAIARGADAPPHERAAILRDLLRAAVTHNMVAVQGTVAWRAYRTLSAALSSGDAVPGGDGMRALLSEIVDRYASNMAEVYRAINGAFGLRMRDGVDERDLSLAIMAMIEGMSDHRRINPSMVDAPRTIVLGPEGARDWHLAGIAVWGIYEAFTQTDPAAPARPTNPPDTPIAS